MVRCRPWTSGGWREALLCILVIALGAGFYGWTFGRWRSPLQGVYTAIKFPLLMLMVTGGNALINGVTASLLGHGMRFREAAMSVLMSFTVAALIMGSLAPVSAFILWNIPPLESGLARTAYPVLLMFHVAVIGIAGIVGNLRMFQVLHQWDLDPLPAGHSTSPASRSAHVLAMQVMGLWLLVNGILGTQLAWIFRPFVGSPGLPTEFLREDALEGNFFEALINSFHHWMGA